MGESPRPAGGSPSPRPGPSAPARGRLRGVDAARGVALLGMMAIHVLPARDPGGGTSAGYLVAHGRSAAAFALLAGVGLALATGRAATGAERAGVRAGVAVRGLAIGAIGLALGYPDSGVAVILPYYAMFFLLAVPLLRLGTGTLAALALATAGVVPVLSHLLRGSLPSADTANPTFADLVDHPVRLAVELALTGYYPVLAWMTYLCAGLAAGRLALRSTRVAAGLLVGGAAMAVAASSVSWLLLNVLGGRHAIAASVSMRDPDQVDRLLSESQYGTTPTTTWWWLSVTSPHSSTPFELLHTTGTALALLGAALLVARVAGGVLLPLAAAGSMTLTLYTTHVLLLASPMLPADATTSYVVQVVAALALATAWRAAMPRGPLEETVAVIAAAARRAVTARRAGTGAW